MRHRGPDDAGLWWSGDGRVGLAHRRLAIIDLSPTGHQPMADASGRLHVTHNGEIYNYRELRRELEARGHRFRTASDTEVILEAYREWGTDCLSRFDGMFAFALYDEDADRLFAARDRIGEKPLFYVPEPGTLRFASELKALLLDPALPRRLDLESLDHYLAYGYVPGERCILQGVRKLPAAHSLVYEPGRDRLEVSRYWELPPPAGDGDERRIGDREEADLAAELETRLLESVRRRLLADVPVGLLLSGGIDSSLVAAMAVRCSSGPVRTFTVTFPGDPDHDEGPYARQVASHLGTEHAEIVAEPASLDLLPQLARQFDEPIADSSMVPTYLVSRAIRPQAKVALGGDGGDELFGGYPHYGWLAWAERLRRLRPLPRALARAGRAMPVGSRGRHHLLGLGGDTSRSAAHINLYFDARLRNRLLGPHSNGEPSPESWKAGLASPPTATLLQRATRADFRSTLVDAYLVKVDRASMLTSLEVRCPWLDHRLVEFAFGRVPDVLRAGRLGRKVLPRRLAARLLPPGLDLERKQGLSLPLDRWLRTDGAGGLSGILRGAEPALFDRRVVEELIDLQRRGYRNAQRIFALALFELWRREYRIGLP
jgi:asparagine synthase (glutamine-hydrolysing)